MRAGARDDLLFPAVWWRGLQDGHVSAAARARAEDARGVGPLRVLEFDLDAALVLGVDVVCYRPDRRRAHDDFVGLLELQAAALDFLASLRIPARLILEDLPAQLAGGPDLAVPVVAVSAAPAPRHAVAIVVDAIAIVVLAARVVLPRGGGAGRPVLRAEEAHSEVGARLGRGHADLAAHLDVRVRVAVVGDVEELRVPFVAAERGRVGRGVARPDVGEIFRGARGVARPDGGKIGGGALVRLDDRSEDFIPDLGEKRERLDDAPLYRGPDFHELAALVGASRVLVDGQRTDSDSDAIRFAQIKVLGLDALEAALVQRAESDVDGQELGVRAAVLHRISRRFSVILYRGQ
mmetsp:Transcript_27455/g.82411  ORF Transcript_27455/g.82411 Transcript_27455/m.82411 type:complete len:350 (-) Transcript_27455:344-1393(-)